MADQVDGMELFAWVGEDETGRLPGLGLKQAIVPSNNVRYHT